MIFQDTHEAIVDKATWELVQTMRGTPRRHDTLGETNPLTGLVFCAGCGSKMYNQRTRGNDSKLAPEQDEFFQETQVVSDMVQQCVFENAHVSLDQTEYQKCCDGLTARFEQAKARLETVMAEIRSRQSQWADIDAFIKFFESLPQELTEFTLDNWLGLVDYATIYSGDDIRFTFKNGQKVQA